jgi:hypothetical protein
MISAGLEVEEKLDEQNTGSNFPGHTRPEKIVLRAQA